MSVFTCTCGHKCNRIIIGAVVGYLGFTCSWCRQKWTAVKPVEDNGQTKLFYHYFTCSCGSNTLDRHNPYCTCEIGDVQ